MQASELRVPTALKCSPCVCSLIHVINTYCGGTRLAQSVADSLSTDHEFEPHIEARVYFKNAYIHSYLLFVHLLVSGTLLGLGTKPSTNIPGSCSLRTCIQL